MCLRLWSLAAAQPIRQQPPRQPAQAVGESTWPPHHPVGNTQPCPIPASWEMLSCCQMAPSSSLMVAVWVRSLGCHPLCGSQRHNLSSRRACCTPVQCQSESADLSHGHWCACRDCWWSAGGSCCWQPHHSPSDVSRCYLRHDC